MRRVRRVSIFRYFSLKYKSHDARKREIDREFSFTRVTQSSQRESPPTKQEKREDAALYAYT